MKSGSTTTTWSPLTTSSHWAVLIAVAAVFALLLVFWETAGSMVEIWHRSETFGHGFLVIPITLWLVWQRRRELAEVPLRPFWPGLVLVAASGFLWLLGALADVSVVKQFAFIFTVQSALLTLLGFATARKLAFPLLFLIFAVPFGDASVPFLIDWTADFTVFALKLSGVAVYREGNSFQLSTGHWSVVEACSGFRYLIATLMASTLFAYLMYRSWWRRVLFIVAAVPASIVANWLRAYLIVMLGHHSNNRLAVDFDHLIYGWMFFGVVLFVLFSIGARFREDVDAVKVPTPVPEGNGLIGFRPSLGAMVAVATLTLLTACIWRPLSSAMISTDSDRPKALLPIDAENGWRKVGLVEDGWQPRFSGHRVALRQVFERQGERVVVYIAYYASQRQGQELINSTNVLLSTEDRVWYEAARDRTALDWGGTRIEVRRSTIAKAGAGFDVIWWYWIDGSTTLSAARAKGALALARLLRRPDDSAAIFLYTEPSERRDSLDLLRAFSSEMGGSIERWLTVTRNGTAQ